MSITTLDYNCSNLESAPDEILIALIQHADILGTQQNEALGLLYDRHHAALYRFANSRQLGSGDDIMMATMVIMIEKLRNGSFQWTGAPLQSWLITIAKVLLKQWRQNPCLPLDDELLKSPIGRPTETVLVSEIAENKARLQTQFRRAKLTQYEQQLVIERLHGRKWQDIADDLGRSHGAVRVAYNKAIKKLRAYYDQR